MTEKNEGFSAENASPVPKDAFEQARTIAQNSKVSADLHAEAQQIAEAHRDALAQQEQRRRERVLEKARQVVRWKGNLETGRLVNPTAEQLKELQRSPEFEYLKSEYLNARYGRHLVVSCINQDGVRMWARLPAEDDPSGIDLWSLPHLTMDGNGFASEPLLVHLDYPYWAGGKGKDNPTYPLPVTQALSEEVQRHHLSRASDARAEQYRREQSKQTPEES